MVRNGTVRYNEFGTATSTLVSAASSEEKTQIYNNLSEVAASPLASHNLSNHLSHHHLLPAYLYTMAGASGQLIPGDTPRASWPVFPRLSNYSWRLLWDNLKLHLRPGRPRVTRQSPGPGVNSHYISGSTTEKQAKHSSHRLLQQRHSGSRPGSPNLLVPLVYTVPVKPLTHTANSCSCWPPASSNPSLTLASLSGPRSPAESSGAASPRVEKQESSNQDKETDRSDLHRNNNSAALAETYQFAETPNTGQRPAFDNLHACC